MQVTKSLGHSVGEYLPPTLTEMWEPVRDFAYLRMPSSGSRCVVALSPYVLSPLSFLSDDDLLQDNAPSHDHIV